MYSSLVYSHVLLNQVPYVLFWVLRVVQGISVKIAKNGGLQPETSGPNGRKREWPRKETGTFFFPMAGSLGKGRETIS